MLTVDLVRATCRAGNLHVTPLKGKDRVRAEELAAEFLAIAAAHVGLAQHALGEASKKTGCSILENVAARAQDCGTGRYRLADSDEVVFVAAGSVQNDQRFSGRRIFGGHEAVDEAKVFSHALGP